MVDISGQVDTSLIVDGEPIDAADVTTPLDDLVGLINNILSGNQDFDQIAFNQATTLTISGGVLTCTQTLHTVAAQSGTADDVDTISADNDTFVVLRADAGDTITLKHGTGNISSISGDDVVLSGNGAVLVFVQGGQAAVIGGGGGSGVDFGTSSELTIASGAVTRTAWHHTIDTESDGASDDLDTISAGGATAGRALIIRPAHTDRTVVVKHGTGNIYLNGGVDFSMDSTEKMTMLIYDGTNWLGVGVPITSGAGSGTVTSVGLSVPAWLSVAGSPVTTSGTLAVSAASGQTANRVLASPDGTTGAVSLRALVADDLPTVPVAGGGTGQTTQAAGFDALSPMTTAGDIVIGGASGTGQRLAIGTAGQVLTVAGGVPTWAAASGGDLVEIVANTVIGSPASSISLTSIPGTYSHLRIVMRLRSDRASNTNDGLNITFNSDTGSNYAWATTAITGAGAGSGAGSVSDTGIKPTTVIAGATATTNTFSTVIIDVPNYAATGYSRTVRGLGDYYFGGAGVNAVSNFVANWVNTANAITQIDIAPLAGSNFIAGSSYSLYGIG